MYRGTVLRLEAERGRAYVRRRGGARRENVAHVCDAGRVELQRLVERHRTLHGEKKTGIKAER